MCSKVEQALHMVGGTGETSYAANSRLQEKTIHRTKSMLAIAVEETYKALHPDQMVVVDLGCSSGPNTLLVLSHVLSVAAKLPTMMELQFFLNDLPGNDFNNLFQSLEGFKKRLERKITGDLLVPYYIARVAGSFYGRFFARASVHLFHSSFCLMWLSQVPEGLKTQCGVPLNKGNIYWTETSLVEVEKAYQEQFQKDFSIFLRSRHTELNVGGRMVLVFVGRRKKTPGNGDFVHLYGLLGEALNSMVLEGIVPEEKVDTFNLPTYGASFEEVKSMIQNEGLFDLDRAEIFESSWDPFDDSKDDFYTISNYTRSGKNVANYIRAVVEPLIVHQFGVAILDDLFERYAHRVTKHLLKEKANHTILVFALKKKAYK
ncbi:anthranilate O-methyltransferase 2-like [Zingiber officinale]|uniref:anthranilate O-methyltransferase 2-like n=1 Tax=Zingiber officinale TaxID=94328 RepID=UPI001C4DB57E|nr:anthranilate O-methyltransferase 2-like [Zingiber officinale]